MKRTIWIPRSRQLRSLMAGCLLVTLAICTVMTAGCTDEAKITKVKETVIPDCNGRTLQDLTAGILEAPVWGLEKTTDGNTFVTVNGTLVGDKLPQWVKDQKMLDIRFRFPLDPKTDAWDPAALNGFPSLTEPEGVLQAYKTITCQ